MIPPIYARVLYRPTYLKRKENLILQLIRYSIISS
jgi:hypothetical protein